ncbi:MAG: hypothetical protein IJT40_00125 [Firmicutes bacterium]|nr:hypothetical protein [Bacillota bacterium]
MFRRLFKGLITIVGGLIGYEIFDLMMYFVSKYMSVTQEELLSQSEEIVLALFFIIIFAIISFNIAPAFSDRSRRAAASIENEIRGVSPVEILGGALGLLLGLIIAYFITTIYQDIIVQKSLYLTVTIIVYSILGFTLAVIGSRKAPELYSLIAATQKKQKENNEYEFNIKDKKDNRIPKILDTSVIIDGRILEIMKAGFLEGPIIIPEFVLVELRHIADSSDSLKRVRGRRGLDILNKIQTEFEIQIYNTDQEKALKEIPEVDVKLLKLAQIMKGKLVTNDFNLNKVAAIKNVPVLNINDLANAVKPISIPGEKMNVKLVKAGKDREQAVAYLDDGTMIVVEDGRKYIGQDVDITVTSVLQTSAGRMIFGKIGK